MNKFAELTAVVVAVTSTLVCADTPREYANVPHTLAATRASAVLKRAEHAFAAYLVACSSRDARDLRAAMTDDAMVEYVSGTPGTYLSVDADSLFSESANEPVWAAGAHGSSNVWIYPTHDANVVFVQYESDPGPTALPQRSHILVLEMRGERIARLRSFSAG